MGLGEFFRDLGAEIDNLVDDALDRKLGGGSTFYGERKSSFSSTKKSYQGISTEEAFKREVARQDIAASTSLSSGGIVLTGEELRLLIFKKWGQRFPVLIKRRRDALGSFRLFLVVQWKYVGKRNLNLSEEEYIAESDAVADLVTEWGAVNAVKDAITESSVRPKTMTQQFPGLFIPLAVDRDIIDSW